MILYITQTDSDILYQIGNQIDDCITFLNFIVSFKKIRNKELLIEQKKQQFIKPIITYYVDGQIKERYYISPNNKKEGLYQSWYKNGKLYEQCNYINGKKEGSYQNWYSSGQLEKECNYINNIREGLFQIWYENGQMSTKYNYINNKTEGLCQS
jgi:antitoxin component YwqK of YwqJK toxin-antitoxin module